MAPSAQVEKRLLWHPRWENKFMVGGGSQMTMYEWAPEESEIRHVTSQNDLQFMKVSFMLESLIQLKVFCTFHLVFRLVARPCI
jgi:hypothetical protein